MPPSLRFLPRLLAPRAYVLAALAATLQTLQLCAIPLAALSIAHEHHASAFAVAVGMAALFAAGGAVRALLVRDARIALTAAAADALLTRDVIGASVSGEDAEMAIFGALYEGERVIAQVSPALAGHALAAVILAVFIVATEPLRLVAVGATGLVFAAASIVLARRATLAAHQRSHAAHVFVIDDVVSALFGRLELTASGRAADFLASLRDRTRHWADVSLRAERLSSLAGRAPTLAAALGVAGALVVGERLHGVSIAETMGEALVFAAVVPAFLGLAREWLELTRSAAGLKPLAELLAAPLGPVGGAEEVPRLPAAIMLRSIRFAYPPTAAAASPLALDDVTIDWRPGEVLVLVGANGSGKSTLLRLLLAVAEPASGTIEVGGADLFGLDLDSWRRCIAYLPQRPFFPDRATVRTGVRHIARDATDAAIEKALARVGLLASLRAKSPEGPLDVPVTALSVGQRQRLALARLLAQDARVLILDEPDANLDAEGIALVADIVRELAPHCMIAIAAHTEQLIAPGDRVVKLVTGKVETERARE